MSGYIPYINLLSQTLTKTQQAPPLVQSCLVEPEKSASKKCSKGDACCTKTGKKVANCDKKKQGCCKSDAKASK